MGEQLPDGFSQRDEWGRAQHPVEKIKRSARDEFAKSGVDFDGSLAIEAALQRQQDIDSAITDALAKLNIPEDTVEE